MATTRKTTAAEKSKKVPVKGTRAVNKLSEKTVKHPFPRKTTTTDKSKKVPVKPIRGVIKQSKKTVKHPFPHLPEKEKIGCYFYILATIYYGINLLEKLAEYLHGVDLSGLFTMAGNKTVELVLQLATISIMIFRKR